MGTVATWRVTAAAATAVVAAYGAVAAADRNPAEFLAAVLTCAVAAAIGLYVGEHRRLLERAAGEQRLRGRAGGPRRTGLDRQGTARRASGTT